MSELIKAVRALSWHVQGGGSHLFVLPEAFDIVRVNTAVFLIDKLQSMGKSAHLFLHDGWGVQCPMSWPEEWLVRGVEFAKPVTKVWLWGVESWSMIPCDRTGKSKNKVPTLRSLFRRCRDLIQVVGHQEMKSGSLVPLELEHIDWKTDLADLTLKDRRHGKSKKMNAETKRSYAEQLREQLEGTVGEFKGHRHHHYHDLGTGGLVELAYDLAREAGSKKDDRYDLLHEALAVQMNKHKIQDPLLDSFLKMLEDKSR